ncbi:DUF2127 domain-containing protein [Cryobacterium sp. MDB1-18-2]|nr:DUF2127 domain-containing protein [Cryobacterium sp. MDB1-18-2]TFC44616.1 DUF2127 domain-containing protein [Cryobacterium sp. MDB1-18-1]
MRWQATSPWRVFRPRNRLDQWEGRYPVASTPTESRRSRTVTDRLYSVGVGIKGIDGVIELAAGLVVWVSPAFVHALLAGVAGEAGEGDSSAMRFLAQYVARLDSELAATGAGFLIAFLITHGAVKVALVYCLLRKWHRAYPYALGILIAFLGYQLYAFVLRPTVGMAVITALDAAIVVLVYREYRELNPRTARQV